MGVVNAESWDGSAEQWETAEEYCADCLIDVNAAAGRDEKVKSHCMLPIRGPDTPADDFVRQAVHAAAGGHGISRVKRPGDVPTEAWDKAVVAAARKLVQLYREMDEEPPESVVELASGEARRALDVGLLSEQVYSQVSGQWSDGYLFGVYYDGGEVFAVVARKGVLYRLPVLIVSGEVVLGTPAKVDMSLDVSEARSSLWLKRQKDGKTRWFALAATAVVNRVGEIDSTSLFSSFVDNVEREGYPELDFFHVTGTEMGVADWLACDGPFLLASGILNDENPLAKALVDALEQGRGKWGVSIAYKPTRPPVYLSVADGVKIPVYVEGVLRRVSVLPEDCAASQMTELEVVMDKRVKDALRALFGDDVDAAERIIRELEAKERQVVSDGMLYRNEVPQPVDQTDAVVDRVTAVVLAALPALVDRAVVNALAAAGIPKSGADVGVDDDLPRKMAEEYRPREVHAGDRPVPGDAAIATLLAAIDETGKSVGK